jgi:hypothetical protein
MAPAGACPFPHEGAPAAAPTARSAADRFVWRLLRIKERPAGGSENAALKAFEKSMLISATRCTLTYIVFPVVVPLLKFLQGWDGIIGIVVGAVAMVCDVFTIRRFFAVGHKWRWYFTAVAGSVICMLGFLLVQDIVNLAQNGFG